MRILVIAQRVPYPPNKGEKLRTFHQLKYLGEQGHQIYVAAPYEAESELEHFTELEQQYCEQVLKAKLSSKPLRLPKALLNGSSLSAANFYSSELQAQIDNLLEQAEIDVILMSASSLAPYAFNSAALQQKSPKLLMDFMDLDSDKWRQYANSAGVPMQWIYAREAQKVAQEEVKIAEAFDQCFLATDKEVELFAQHFPEFTNVSTLENGLDTSEFYPPAQARDTSSPSLLFAGVMDYKPNVDAVTWFVDNCWNQIIEIWPNAKLCIAGMNPTEKVQALAENRGISVTGFVDDIKPYFDQANIFIAPFRIARGVQNKVLQAFASGLPVIATEMGAEGIECEHSQNIMLATVPSDFVEGLETLCGEPETYQLLSDNALKLIQDKYEWDGKLASLARALPDLD